MNKHRKINSFICLWNIHPQTARNRFKRRKNIWQNWLLFRRELIHYFRAGCFTSVPTPVSIFTQVRTSSCKYFTNLMINERNPAPRTKIVTQARALKKSVSFPAVNVICQRVKCYFTCVHLNYIFFLYKHKSWWNHPDPYSRRLNKDRTKQLKNVLCLF